MKIRLDKLSKLKGKPVILTSEKPGYSVEVKEFKFDNFLLTNNYQNITFNHSKLTLIDDIAQVDEELSDSLAYFENELSRIKESLIEYAKSHEERYSTINDLINSCKTEGIKERIYKDSIQVFKFLKGLNTRISNDSLNTSNNLSKKLEIEKFDQFVNNGIDKKIADYNNLCLKGEVEDILAENNIINRTIKYQPFSFGIGWIPISSSPVVDNSVDNFYINLTEWIGSLKLWYLSESLYLYNFIPSKNKIKIGGSIKINRCIFSDYSNNLSVDLGTGIYYDRKGISQIITIPVTFEDIFSKQGLTNFNLKCSYNKTIKLNELPKFSANYDFISISIIKKFGQEKKVDRD